MSSHVQRVGVIIPSTLRSTRLEACVASVVVAAGQCALPVEVVVAVNGVDARDAERRRISAMNHAVTVLQFRQPGKAAAANAAARAVQGDLLVFTDDDVIVPVQWISRIAEEVNRGADLVGMAIVPRWPDRPPKWYDESLGGVVGSLRRTSAEPPLPAGACIACRRDVFERVAGFDEALARGEDFDFARRVIAAGHTYRFVDDCAVLHHVEASMVRRRYFMCWFVGAGLEDRTFGANESGPLVPRFLWGEMARASSLAFVPRGRPRFVQILRAVYLLSVVSGLILGRYAPRAKAFAVRGAYAQLRSMRRRGIA